MSPLLIGFLAFFAIIVLSALGVPVGVALALTAAGGMAALSGTDFMLVMFQTIPFSTAAQYAFVVVPTFILMGNLAAASGMIEAMFNAAASWLAGRRGALYIAVTFASAGFATVSGSTVVNAAVFSRIALPHMLRLGYARGVSAACIASAGTFAVMIPPSLGFVIYGIMTGESVGRLFMAGVVPGLLTVIGYVLTINLLVRWRPEIAPRDDAPVPLRERVVLLRPLWSFVLLVFAVLGGIYGGIFSPSAAGSIGAIGALLIGLAQRRLNLPKIVAAAIDAAQLTASIFFIVITGFIFARFMITSGFVPEIVTLLSSAGIGPYGFIAILAVAYLILGMFIDGASMAVITLPLVYPVAQRLGIDGIWLGVLFVKMVEIGAITPPMGINLFATVAASDGAVRLSDLIRGIAPFVALEIVILIVLILVPQLSLALPSMMF